MKILDISVMQWLWYRMVKVMPQTCAKILYWKALRRWPDFRHPKDLNEKINYLKFHADMNEWARLADKYAVREYVENKGHKEILPQLYGKFDTAEELIKAWDDLPNQFVLKSNNGCGTVRLVKEKKSENVDDIFKIVKEWLQTKRVGVGTVEPHYTLIKPCLIAEELLVDDKTSIISCSLVDYKIWCFNGKPYCILVILNRNIEKHKYTPDVYSVSWARISNVLANPTKIDLIEKPSNLNEMLNIASVLSKGHPQMRVDLYCVNGKTYFGELTMGSAGGYMDYFTQDFLLKLGQQFSVN